MTPLQIAALNYVAKHAGDSEESIMQGLGRELDPGTAERLMTVMQANGLVTKKGRHLALTTLGWQTLASAYRGRTVNGGPL